MIVNKQLVNRVKDYFDLNIYETKVWVALLSKGVATAGEISEISEVPRSRTYDVLESLEKRGFAIEKIGKPTQYIAVKPKTVLEKLKKDSYREAKEKAKNLDDLKNKEEFEKLTELHENSFDPVKKKDVSGAVQGEKDIYSHAQEIIEEAEHEVFICIPAEEALEKGRTFRKLFNKLKDKKVKFDIAVKGSDQDLEKISQIYEIDLKKTNLDTKFFLVDRKKILFNLNKAQEDEEMAVWLDSEFFTNAFAQLFETAMKGSK